VEQQADYLTFSRILKSYRIQPNMIRLTSNLSRHAVTAREHSMQDFVKCRSIRRKSASPSVSTDFSTATDAHFMLILGKPGGGKGTISKKILQDFPTFKHLSTGDLLRQHVREKTEIGVEAKKHMDEGGLVPNELMIELVLEDASRELDNGNSLLLDGFPRTLEQAAALDERLELDLVVDLNVPTETIIERISDRYVLPYLRFLSIQIF